MSDRLPIRHYKAPCASTVHSPSHDLHASRAGRTSAFRKKLWHSLPALRLERRIGRWTVMSSQGEYMSASYGGRRRELALAICVGLAVGAAWCASATRRASRVLILALCVTGCHHDLSEPSARILALEAAHALHCQEDVQRMSEAQGDSWQYGWQCKPDAAGDIQIVWVNVTKTGVVTTNVEHRGPGDPATPSTVFIIPHGR